MMRNCLVVFLLLIFTPAFSQDNAPAVNQGDTIYFVYTAFQFQSGKPFFNWIERPDSVDFKMYDRWGNLVAKSNEIDFRIDDVFLKKIKPQIDNTYFYQLKVILKNGKEQNYMFPCRYTGAYCGG